MWCTTGLGDASITRCSATKLHACSEKKSVADKANIVALSKLSYIALPKFTADNYEIFNTVFCSIVGRNIVMNGIPIQYVIRGVTGNYYSSWTNQEDNLNNCLLHTSNYFNSHNITLQSF